MRCLFHSNVCELRLQYLLWSVILKIWLFVCEVWEQHSNAVAQGRRHFSKTFLPWNLQWSISAVSVISEWILRNSLSLATGYACTDRLSLSMIQPNAQCRLLLVWRRLLLRCHRCTNLSQLVTKKRCEPEGNFFQVPFEAQNPEIQRALKVYQVFVLAFSYIYIFTYIYIYMCFWQHMLSVSSQLPKAVCYHCLNWLSMGMFEE